MSPRAERMSGPARVFPTTPTPPVPAGDCRPIRYRPRNRSAVRFPLLALVCLAATGCGQKPVAVVNGEPIMRDAYYQRMLNYSRGTQPNMATGMQILESVIQDRLLLAEAKRENVLPTDAEINARLDEIRKAMQEQGASLEQQLQHAGLTLDGIRHDVTIALAQEKLVTKGITISDQEIQKFYEQNKKRPPFSSPKQLRLQHMTVDSQAKAVEARKDLRNADFGLVAMSRSIDMFKEMQGQVPIPITEQIQPGSPIAPAVIRKAFTMKKDEISEPIKVGNQWVIVKVMEIIPAKTQQLEEVREEIRRGLLQQRAEQNGNANRVSQRLAQLRQQADIQINIDQYQASPLFQPQPAPGVPPLPGSAAAPPVTPPAGGR